MEKAGTKGDNFSNFDYPPPYEPPRYDGQQYQRSRNYRQPYPGQHPGAGQQLFTVQQQYELQPYGRLTHVQSPTTVIVTQPQVETTMSRHHDYMVPSIFACLCCCHAVMANRAAAAGDMDAADRYYKSARSLVITSIVIGIVWICISVVANVRRANSQY